MPWWLSSLAGYLSNMLIRILYLGEDSTPAVTISIRMKIRLYAIYLSKSKIKRQLSVASWLQTKDMSFPFKYNIDSGVQKLMLINLI